MGYWHSPQTDSVLSERLPEARKHVILSHKLIRAGRTINEHIRHIFDEGELEESMVVKKFGNSEFQQKAPFYYNLDVIISVGYRVKSLRGTQFRQWATKRLNEYIRKGFTLDDERREAPAGQRFREP